MVVRVDVGNAEAQGHHVQESRLGQLGALCAEIVARGEFQFVHAGGKVGAFQQRLVAAAVVSGLGCASAPRSNDASLPAALACRTSRGASLASSDPIPSLTSSPALRWITTYDARERAALDRWCAGVGPAVVTGALTATSSTTTTVGEKESSFPSTEERIRARPNGARMP